MPLKNLLFVISLILTVTPDKVNAALSEDELAQLGTTLTPWGAEKAGSEDGSYPAYTGGLKAPEGFDLESGQWPDPFPQDKPLFTITADNMGEYADRLTEGFSELLRRYPTFHMNIYPTRRVVFMPKRQIENALKNARNPECKTSEDGVGLYGCWGGTPFPIPKNGFEVMWNHNVKEGPNAIGQANQYLMDSRGVRTKMLTVATYQEFPYLDSELTPYKGAGAYSSRLIAHTIYPPRDLDAKVMLWYPLEFDKYDQRAWSYTPGQRRVRLAPEFSYDTPAPQVAGTMYFDELGMFAGRMDRFDFRLKGKKLMYMPYDQFRLNATKDPDKVITPHHPNVDLMRWELRRVWVVEAVPRPGKRHVAKIKRFYVDEDSWAILYYEGLDQADKLFRVVLSMGQPDYAYGGWQSFGNAVVAFDLNKNQYCYIGSQAEEAFYKAIVTRKPEAEMAPSRMAGTGIR